MSKPGVIHRSLVHRSVGRVGVSVIAAVAAAMALIEALGTLAGLLAGWDIGGLVLLSITWWLIWHSDAARTRERAAGTDPGRTAVWALVLVSSGVSLLAAVLLAQRARHLAPHAALTLALLSLATVSLSWAMTHTAFTMRYAHLFYRDDEEGVGGVTFPGNEEPDYFDFAYLAFTLGMTFQTSDTCITSRRIRRLALLHATLAFAYNTAILTFALNFAFTLAV